MLTRMSCLAVMAVSGLLCSLCHAAVGPPRGDDAHKEQLKPAINEEVEPKLIVHKPLPDRLREWLAWSKPINGVAARIDDVWAARVVFVRLKNVSGRPLSVPAGNPADAKATPWFEINVRQRSHPWRRHVSGSRPIAPYFGEPTHPTDPPWVKLQPGEESIALVPVYDEQNTGGRKFVKAILRLPDPGAAERWRGVLETPQRPLELSREHSRILREALPFPDHYPQLDYDTSGFVSGRPHSPDAMELHTANRPLFDMLSIYQAEGVRKEFERRMRAENKLPMKFLLASAAAAAGSDEARLLFSYPRSDYETVINLHHALWISYWNYSRRSPDVENQEPPEWLVELSLALLADHRHVTVLDNAKIPRETSLTIASLSSDLAVVVSHSKNQQARQMLVDLLNTGGIDLPTLMALAKMGDKRAVPFLIEALAAAKTLPPDREQRLAPEYASAVSALARLKARDAVPVLLRHVEYLEIIDCLGTIGDPRALPVLHKVVASKGTVLRDGRRINSELEGERLFAARMAMARIDDADEIPQLVQMLTEPSLTRSHRYDIVTRLADRPESQAIPQLLKVIRTDADYYIIDLAIQGLAQRKDKAAVVGLIDCLDAPFKEFVRTKENRATSATYHNLIACALHRITGQKFGADKVRWQKWWQETGRNSTALK